MTDRIKAIADKTVKGKMYVYPVETKYDPTDLFMSHVKMSGKRVCEYILNQKPLIEDESCFTGLITFDGSVEGDIFSRAGHRNFGEICSAFYSKPIDNLLTFEWQHATGDFGKIINRGIAGIKKDIAKSMEIHSGEIEKTEFLETQADLCEAIIKWAKKCSGKALEKSGTAVDAEYKSNLIKLSEGLNKVPEYPAESFYEAVLSLYVVYAYIPDSIGLIDRYLYPFYIKDKADGILTDRQAKEYLQELYLMLQARISIDSDRFYRGGESHFCIGGYNENGEDNFNELSRISVEALMDLPTWIPQISLRWTAKTPREVLRFMLDCERKDPNKRIAFVNDEPRLKGLTEYSGFSYKEAINYSMIGCNELSLPGGIVFGFDPLNVTRSLANTFHKKSKEIIKTETFRDFLAVYKKELFNDLWEAEKISKGLQAARSRDCNIVSNIFLDGCIENGSSVTQGGIDKFTAVGLLIGITTVIDSLSITKQFVFDEKLITMEELVNALKNNWEGYKDLRQIILKKGNFFGNDDNCSNEAAEIFTSAIAEWNNADNYMGKKWIFGNLIGYNEHNKFFGDKTEATPDGRHYGDPVSFGIGQSEGKDREGLTALLNSVAKCDPQAVLTGPSVTNILLDEQLIMNEDSFEKLVLLFETYFKNGGTHFQLSYVNTEDMINAQITPDNYRNLRVRVSGFSDYFVFLNKNLQDEIIIRTKHSS